jgi:hypothetical protein
MLVLLYANSLSSRAFSSLFIAAEWVSFAVGIALCWVWPLTRLLGIFNPKGGALSELAMLPGLGSGAQQLRRLYLVALGLPVAGLIVLLVSAVTLVSFQQLSNTVYLKIALEFLLIPLVTLPTLLGQFARPRKPGWAVTVAIFCQPFTFTLLLWNGIWDDTSHSAVLRAMRWTLAGIVLFGVMVIIGISIYWARKVAQRPHPFMEMPT